ncbi:MAG: hypothetical protein ACERKZ_02290 [Lachnotalea sp.]
MDERLIEMIHLIMETKGADPTFTIDSEAILPTVILKDCCHNIIETLIHCNYSLRMGTKGLYVTDLKSKKERGLV